MKDLHKLVPERLNRRLSGTKRRYFQLVQVFRRRSETLQTVDLGERGSGESLQPFGGRAKSNREPVRGKRISRRAWIDAHAVSPAQILTQGFAQLDVEQLGECAQVITVLSGVLERPGEDQCGAGFRLSAL